MSRIGKNSQQRVRSTSEIIVPFNISKRKKNQRQRVQSFTAKENEQIISNNESKTILKKFNETHRRSINSQLLYIEENNNDNSNRSSFRQSTAIYDKLVETDFLQKLQNDDTISIKYSSNKKDDKNDDIQNVSNKIVLKWIRKFETERKFTFRCFEDFTKSKLNLLSEKPLDVSSFYTDKLKVAICCLVLQNLFDEHLSIIHPKLKQLLKKELFESIYCSLIKTHKHYELREFYESIPYFVVDKKISINEENDKESLKREEAKKKIGMIRGVFKAQNALQNLLKVMKGDDYLRKVLVGWKIYTYKKIGKRKDALSFCDKLVLNWSKMDQHSLFRVWKRIIIEKKRECKQEAINKVKKEIKLQLEYKRKTHQHIQDLQDNIKSLTLKMKVNEQFNRVQSAKGKSLSFSKGMQAQRKFQILLQKLRELKTELTEFITTPHFNIELIFNGEDTATDALIIEQYAMLWLKYQLKWIQIQQMKQRRAFINNVDDADDERLSQYSKIEQILEKILLETKYNNFDQDFQNGHIWLLLFFYLFQGKGFRDLSELNTLCDEQTVTPKRINKIISLYKILLTSEEASNVLVNFNKLMENNVNCNFILLLSFMTRKSNLMLKNEDIALFKVRINGGIKHCSSIISIMINNSNVLSLYQKEASRIEQIINCIEKAKVKLISNHSTWCDIQHQITKRILTETNNYKLGKLVLIQPSKDTNKIIQNLLRMDYIFVKPIFERYYRNSNNNVQRVSDLALQDFRTIPDVVHNNLSVIMYLLEKYLNLSSMSITLKNWKKLSKDLHIKSKLNLQRLFKTSSQKRDIKYFVPLLIFTADTVYKNEGIKISDRLELLLQRYILQQIHPQCDIVSISNMHSMRLLMQEKQFKLDDIWKKLASVGAENKEINIDSVIEFFSKHTSLSAQMLTRMKSKRSMNFQDFYGVVCYIAQETKSQLEFKSFCGTVSSFIDKL